MEYLIVISYFFQNNTNFISFSHSLIAKGISWRFEKTHVFKGTSTYWRVSCCCICFSIITELINLGNRELENIAHVFAKHDKKSCKWFYVQFWNNREAVHLCWKFCKMLRPLTDIDRKALEKTEASLAKNPSNQWKISRNGTKPGKT